MMRSFILTALVLGSYVCAQDTSATVFLRFTDAFGRSIGPAKLLLVSREGTITHLDAKAEGIEIKLLPGPYKMTVEVVGFETRSRDIIIPERTKSIISVGLCVANLGDPAPSAVFPLRGEIVGSPGDRTEVRMLGIFNSEQKVAIVSKDGRFAANLSCEGKYILLVVADGVIVGTRIIDVYQQNSPLVFDVRSK